MKRKHTVSISSSSDTDSDSSMENLMSKVRQFMRRCEMHDRRTQAQQSSGLNVNDDQRHTRSIPGSSSDSGNFDCSDYLGRASETTNLHEPEPSLDDDSELVDGAANHDVELTVFSLAATSNDLSSVAECENQHGDVRAGPSGLAQSAGQKNQHEDNSSSSSSSDFKGFLSGTINSRWSELDPIVGDSEALDVDVDLDAPCDYSHSLTKCGNQDEDVGAFKTTEKDNNATCFGFGGRQTKTFLCSEWDAFEEVHLSILNQEERSSRKQVKIPELEDEQGPSGDPCSSTKSILNQEERSSCKQVKIPELEEEQGPSDPCSSTKSRKSSRSHSGNSSIKSKQQCGTSDVTTLATQLDALKPDLRELKEKPHLPEQPTNEMEDEASTLRDGDQVELPVTRSKATSICIGLRQVQEDGSRISTFHADFERMVKKHERYTGERLERVHIPEMPLTDFKILTKIGRGSYGDVYKALDKTGKTVALKEVSHRHRNGGMTFSTVREVMCLSRLHHRNIVNFRGVVTEPDKVAFHLLLDYEPYDLNGLLNRNLTFNDDEKCYIMWQVLEGVNYCHQNDVLHRDIKTSNILINTRGEVKVADFGLARIVPSTTRPLSNSVVTLWYKPPEIIMGETRYGPAVDVWSCGCVLGEIFVRKPIFSCTLDIFMLRTIYKVCGTPDTNSWPDIVSLPSYFTFKPGKTYPRILRSVFKTYMPTPAIDLLDAMLCHNPAQRITLQAALQCEWMKDAHLKNFRTLVLKEFDEVIHD